MRWLIGYSTCPFTRAALEAEGHEVWTCDLRADDHPRHLQCDIWEVAGDRWDAGIFHPTCTYLTCSAAWAFSDPDYDRYPGVGYHQKVEPDTPVGAERRALREEAIENFKRLDALPFPKAIENPAPSFVSGSHRPPDQTIQPYDFGDNASKRTGLWLDRLGLLAPTMRVPGRLVEWPRGSGRMVERWSNQTDSGQNNVTPGADRWLDRSRTYPGIAAAFGDQWGRHGPVRDLFSLAS
ncbi:hypothetical protein [Hyphococcus sp.]|uniref:hypothetical protein n=1 Tax=Hyphococcus sp. TaxID=2038636 RepID=UPI002083A40C|nr:MAG: hypothetical protein DHS20C04_27350 [Marinicaulis sp.]